MIRQLERMYYPLAIFMIFVVIVAAINDILYLLLFIPVLMLLACIKKYTITFRLKYKGITTKAKIIEYESYLNFDEDLATSRRGDVKKEILIMEFLIKDNKVIKGQPIEYDINVPELEDTDFEYPYNEKFIAFRDFNPVGEVYEITYDRERPTVFTFKDSVGDNTGALLTLIYILSGIIVCTFAYVLSKYSIIGTIGSLFS